jgi:hypothetical protein
MEKARKREIVQQYKERKSAPGIYAVRCKPTNDVWVGITRDLESQRNGTFFMLRQGSHTNKKMLAAWNAHGEANFAYEPLEEIDAKDFTPYLLNAALKEREQHWRKELSAGNVIG